MNAAAGAGVAIVAIELIDPEVEIDALPVPADAKVAVFVKEKVGLYGKRPVDLDTV